MIIGCIEPAVAYDGQLIAYFEPQRGSSKRASRGRGRERAASSRALGRTGLGSRTPQGRRRMSHWQLKAVESDCIEALCSRRAAP